jgi:hypothetical protein
MPPGKAAAQAPKKKKLGGGTKNQINKIKTDPLSHQTIILGVGVLVDPPRKPINLTWQNSTSRGIGQKYQIDPNLKETTMRT